MFPSDCRNVSGIVLHCQYYWIWNFCRHTNTLKYTNSFIYVHHMRIEFILIAWHFVLKFTWALVTAIFICLSYTIFLVFIILTFSFILWIFDLTPLFFLWRMEIPCEFVKYMWKNVLQKIAKSNSQNHSISKKNWNTIWHWNENQK